MWVRAVKSSEHGHTNPHHVSMQGLASLFKAPAELLFHGSFDEAKAKALEDGKWLVSLELPSSPGDVGFRVGQV